MPVRRFAIFAAALVLAGLAILPNLPARVPAPAAAAQAQAQGNPPPEVKEWIAALRLPDPAARLKEMRRIAAAYPKSQFRSRFETAILQAEYLMAPDAGAAVRVQQEILRKATDPRDRFLEHFNAGVNLLRHPNLSKFEKAAVVKAVVQLSEAGREIARSKAFLDEVPADQKGYVAANAANLLLPEVQAYLFGGDAARAAEAMKRFDAEGGAESPYSNFLRGSVLLARGDAREAYGPLFKAAAGSYPGAREAAAAAYAKVHGSPAGFEAELDAALRALPYPPAPRRAGPGTGKVVLAELFTGSECPPCVAADLGFDGLLETFGPRELAVLEYHVHIPRPDPMANLASLARGQAYGIDSTPSTFFDGAAQAPGGGGRDDARAKYEQYAAAVRARLAEPGAPALAAKAALRGDRLEVEFTAGPLPKEADLHLALVQKEERYKGANGLAFHKMVVRDLVTLDAAARKARRASFDLAAVDAATSAYLDEYAKSVGWKFSEPRFRADRGGLRAVLFAQDRATRKVLNAAVADPASAK